jgi:GNAT superfamily N-acetyltransferase
LATGVVSQFRFGGYIVRMVAPAETRIRLATQADVPVLRGLIDASVRGLQTEDYSPTQIDHALQTVFGVDSQLIADGTYFAAEARAKDAAEFVVAGCGGWSRRKKLHGGDAWTEQRKELLDPAVDAAKIRAFFISPAFARMGIGTQILEACEMAAIAAGFRRLEMSATLTGAKLFRTRGYVEIERMALDIGGGEMLPVVHMEKRV